MFWSCERGRVGSVERAARWAGVGEGACMVIVVAMGVVAGVLGAVAGRW